MTWTPPKEKVVAKAWTPPVDKVAPVQSQPPQPQSSLLDTVAENIQPNRLAQTGSPSNLFKLAGVASANAPGAAGMLLNSMPGGDASQITPSLLNVIRKPGQVRNALTRMAQVQGGSPLTSQEKVPAYTGQVVGTGIEMLAPNVFKEIPMKADGPFMAGVQAPSTALPGAFNRAGKALGEAKSLAGAGDESLEVSRVLARMEDPKEAGLMLGEARDWVRNGMKGEKSLAELMAYQDLLGKAQSAGGKLSNVYASGVRKIASVIESKFPDLAAKTEKMRLNYLAEGKSFPWLMAAINPKVAAAKIFTLPQVRNAAGAVLGIGKNLLERSNVTIPLANRLNEAFKRNQ